MATSVDKKEKEKGKKRREGGPQEWESEKKQAFDGRLGAKSALLKDWDVLSFFRKLFLFKGTISWLDIQVGRHETR